MFSLFRNKKPVPVVPPFDFDKNPYKAHAKWPPFFNEMTEREQFRLERKFRRRSKLKWARPVWNRNLQLIQWGTTIFLAGYCTFAVDWSGNQVGEKEMPPGYLKNVRAWLDDAMDSIWTHSSSKSSQEHVAFLQDRYKGDVPGNKPVPST